MSALIEDGEHLHKEVFFLAYHLHWGHGEVMDLPTAERFEYLRLLVAQLEREQQSIEETRKVIR